jgi:hypothetical protein
MLLDGLLMSLALKIKNKIKIKEKPKHVRYTHKIRENVVDNSFNNFTGACN